MRKMIIAACAIALASVVQAAAVGWTLAGLKDYAGDAYSFFVIGQKGVESISQITAMCAAGEDVSSFALKSDKIASNGAGTLLATQTGVSLDAGKTYESFFVVFDNEDVSKAGNYIAITSEQAAGLIQSPGASAASFLFAGANQQSYVTTASNWSKVAGSGVPEPTSGLLLVLGCAALALRRKQK